MKKMIWRIPVAILGVLLVLAIALVAFMEIKGWIVQQGRYLETKSGGAMLIYGNSPTELHNPTGRDLFEGLTTGDKILVVRSNVTLESYPEQTTAYAVIKLRDGTIEDIPKGVIEQLTELQRLEAE